ncbi:hypothetical protein [Achromobacter phage kwar_LB4]|nr:hypothetical protein [Achromobacter phage kwar_LB4]
MVFVVIIVRVRSLYSALRASRTKETHERAK